jgi:hypothetical protein
MNLINSFLQLHRYLEPLPQIPSSRPFHLHRVFKTSFPGVFQKSLSRDLHHQLKRIDLKERVKETLVILKLSKVRSLPQPSFRPPPHPQMNLPPLYPYVLNSSRNPQHDLPQEELKSLQPQQMTDLMRSQKMEMKMTMIALLSYHFQVRHI